MATYQDITDLAAHSIPGSKASVVPSRQSMRLFLYIELLATDWLALIIGTVIPGLVLGTDRMPYNGFGATLLLLPLFAILGMNNGAYTIDVLRKPYEGVRRALMALVLAMVSVLLVVFLLKANVMISRLTFVVQSGLSAVLVVLGRIVVQGHVRSLTKGRLLNELVITDGVEVAHQSTTLTVDAPRLKLVPDAFDPRMLHRFGTLTKGFDRVIVHCEPDRRSAWALLLKGADVDGEILIDQFNEIGAIGLSDFNGFDTVLVSRRALSLRQRAKKRMLDLAVSVPLVIALLPILGLVALAIKLDSPGPVLFKQDRVGRANRMFKVLKFRSMRTEECDSDGAQSTQRADNRITRVGRFIRKTSLDELPQLINVLLGEMSLVGPRPHALGSLAGKHLFWEVDQTYWHRHRLKPGITGLAQIRGYRGATHETLDLTNRLQADLEYIEGWQIWRDVNILAGTFRVLIHRNAY
jgi:exopolysaccharide biosynthesis polyprenyl glycosylphosphotransferase